MWPVALSIFTKVSTPVNLVAKSLIETSACGLGTLKRVADTAYSVFCVTKGDA